MHSYVCVLSTNEYLDGLLVINENLKRLKSNYPLLCLINENISKETREILNKFQIPYKEQKSVILESDYGKTRWGYTFDKLNIFNLTEYEKIVYLDLDFLLLENIDHLFDIDVFSMVSDHPKYENYYCSALMVIKPNKDDYDALISLLEEKNKSGVSGIGDQDLINEHFKNNKNKIPIEYNFIKGIKPQMIEVFDEIKGETTQKYFCKDYYYSEKPKIIHYYGDIKPFSIKKEFDDEYCHLYYYYLSIVRKQKRRLTQS
ncbi:hypothetical protein IKT18_00980 [Candidatus Saccharibacteria bacterium]|nr:hypothetical protein [Candidatus Saccharibacteria bacterium]